MELVLANKYYWTSKNLGYDGLSQVYNVQSGNKTGLFMATQFSFISASVGYMGLQPKEDKGFMALFSYFGKNVTSNHPNCKSGADYGNGMTCRVYFDLVYDRNYTVSISLVSENPNNTNTWEGILVDDFGYKLSIGSWTIPKSLIDNQVSQFMEWYVMNGHWNIPAAKRPCMPKLDFEFWRPIFSKAGTYYNTWKSYFTSSKLNDSCCFKSGIPDASNEFCEPLPDGGYRSIVGKYTPDVDGYYYAK